LKFSLFSQGIAVGMPIYFATGSKWKALVWGTLAGFPLPIGGLIVRSLACHAFYRKQKSNSIVSQQWHHRCL